MYDHTNLPSVPKLPKPKNHDFRFGAANFAVLMVIIIIATFIQSRIDIPRSADIVFRPDITLLITGLAIGLILTQVPKWQVVIGLGILHWIKIQLAFEEINMLPTYIGTYLGMLISCSVQIAQQWERGVVLRLGKFQSLRGPGFLMVVPFIDRIDRFVDHRVRAIDFTAETTLTKDTVPVNVDAIAFWLVWDAKMSVLEVEDYVSAVILSAQTALRDAIGRHALSEMLEDRDNLGREIQKVLDKKTDPWGVTIQSIEIRDIIIPKGLEDAMSRQAQAERERQSRVILGTAETEIAVKFAEASKSYENNPTALHLRAMNMVFEGLKQKGTMMIVPSSALDTMSLGAMGGLAALGKQDATFPTPLDDDSLDTDESDETGKK
jgi:SPFH domain / Band 7 family